ncbi:hypothetical protein OU5_2912 [Pseudomonas mandelii JR-1]|uniref:Uncharacterized protein n=1 Tax=Pseudomonas mandelii JR-1 TaxID=1147786 RepID=A0A024EBJ0_9PSED|nr:hypothetical protein OU5_2912 [Pseudomonas mandelii JR-1]
MSRVSSSLLTLTGQSETPHPELTYTNPCRSEPARDCGVSFNIHID